MQPFIWLIERGQEASPSGETGFPLTNLQPHPRPLSEWRGE
ncbi:hypothetical protein HMPREF0973_02567 [Prevotella veroralis F0319]|uniref:Uncharacterized protein n=1 Tax=Prevotella veroralis F0319 TaxID=649761 RepID=C9MSE8_9BACT|nr:hypothetical protein HMPREF0973_02567 [Prevotella veroralis F0319]